MSKLIVEMEMPMSCPCDLTNGDTPCFAAHGIPKRWADFEKHSKLLHTRPWWCPIKGVLPEDHGDLIDRDIMYREIQLWKSTATDTVVMCFLWHIEKMLMCIRPIIAAERKDDEQIH